MQLITPSCPAFVFLCSIRENILYGRQDATEAEVVEAAKAANAYSFISSLPKGLDTDVSGILKFLLQVIGMKRKSGFFKQGGLKLGLPFVRCLPENGT